MRGKDCVCQEWLRNKAWEAADAPSPHLFKCSIYGLLSGNKPTGLVGWEMQKAGWNLPDCVWQHFLMLSQQENSLLMQSAASVTNCNRNQNVRSLSNSLIRGWMSLLRIPIISHCSLSRQADSIFGLFQVVIRNIPRLKRCTHNYGWFILWLLLPGRIGTMRKPKAEIWA